MQSCCGCLLLSLLLYTPAPRPIAGSVPQLIVYEPMYGNFWDPPLDSVQQSQAPSPRGQ